MPEQSIARIVPILPVKNLARAIVIATMHFDDPRISRRSRRIRHGNRERTRRRH